MKSPYLAIAAICFTLSCSDDPDGSTNTKANNMMADSGPVDAGADASNDTGGSADANSDASDLGTDAGEIADAADMTEADMADNPCGFRDPSTLSIYNGIDGLQDAALVTALNGIVAPHSGQTYDEAREAMYISPGIDVDRDGTIEGIYTGVRIEPDDTKAPEGPEGQITTEHSWPRIDGAGMFPAEGDIHHLFPALSLPNTRRGNHPYGETACDDPGEAACDWSEAGSQLGGGVDGQPFVFEVRPAFRGDVARAHFYFSVRYELPIEPVEEAVLRDWHCEDPPDLDELIRNDLVENVQQNRNPFVDRPRLVDAISDF